MEQQPHPDFLEDIQTELYAEPAAKGQRLANYLIDLFIFYILIVAVIVAIMLITANKEILNTIEANSIFVNLMGTALYGLYMGFLEGITNGRSVGKFITKTKAVQETGSKLTMKEGMHRGLIRIVPFELFSGLGDLPWHDKWTTTRVIRIRQS